MGTTTSIQQGDVELFQTPDGGEICIIDGVAEMTPGLEVAAYLSLFGGNEGDDGSEGSPLEWWGNLGETIQSRKLRSRTQTLLEGLPATSGNLQRLKQAVENDLAWILTDKIASSIRVALAIPTVNHISILIIIEAFGEQSTFTFTENWRASI